MLAFAMETRGASPFVAGDLGLADFSLAPIPFSVTLTPDKAAVFDLPGFADWWDRVQALASDTTTEPKRG
jgi:glutathione S-transferase